MGLIHWLRQRMGREDAVLVRVPMDGIKGRLYASPMPFGPYDVRNQLLKRYREERIEFAIPLVTDAEMQKKLKRDLLDAYRDAGIEAIRFPIADLTSPQLDDVRALVARVAPYVRAGARMVVHCNAGVGRTGVVIACLLVDLLGLGGDAAVAHVKAAMATQMTDSQVRVVRKFAGQPADADADAAAAG